ncbi:MAG TPA: maleylpyruvate isomerase N-terminal domain-containing protein [Acidimicrobiales bacterium]|nr:maleylpyruvate isomerase N-terminal domain-containing protein [Acidimicrobiales bacterium]
MLHHLDPLTTRSAFTDAAAVFLATVAAVADDQWEQPGVGEWTVRELTAHAIRSFETLERLCDTAAATPVVESASAYYRVVAELPDVHRGVAQRAREAAARLVEPVRSAGTAAERALDRLAATPDDHVGESFVGPMRFGDYLPTRLVELGIHTLDLQGSTGQTLTLPRSAVGVILGVLADLTDGPTVLLALTGRRPLPAGFNLLG